MSAATACADAGDPLPLLLADHPDRALAFDGDGRISAACFLADVAATADALPPHPLALNLCEDRYAFLVAFCALAASGRGSLLPHSRAPVVVAEMLARHPEACCIAERPPEVRPERLHLLPPFGRQGRSGGVPRLPASSLVAVGFTSGSTGQPCSHGKRWGRFVEVTRRNAALLAPLAGGRMDLVATVPPQHMYGMEMTVLLPLLADVAVHTGRPFFPAEIARALEQALAPRVLVTTPVHLRTLLESGEALPPLAGIVTATAPLPAALAQAAEDRYGAPVQEVFGSTETCVIAQRRSAREAHWQLYDGVQLAPQPDGTQVSAPWIEGAVTLQDVVELLPDRRFALRGRNTDLVEIAGKRASLGELTQRLLAVPGVRDAVVFQSEEGDAAGVRRIAALAVAPGLTTDAVLAELRRSLDPVFLPRPLRLLQALPRNETGKLPRAALLALLRGG